MNFDYGLKLAAPVPCPSRAVTYAANVFVATTTRSAVVRRLQLEEKQMDANPDALRQYSDRTIRALSSEERRRVIAINYFKLCLGGQHKNLQLERVGAAAFTRTDSDYYPIQPATLKTSDGIGSVRCAIPNHKLFEPVVDFAVTEADRFSNPPTAVISAGIEIPGRQTAYIVLRGLETLIQVR